MIDILYPLILVCNYLVPVLILTFFVNVEKKPLIIYSIIVYIVLGYLYINDIIVYVFLMPIILFLYLLIIYKKFLISIVLSSFIWVLILISDASTGAILIYILKYNYSDINGNDILLDIISQFLIFLIASILSYITRIILLKIFKKININSEIIAKKHHVIFIFSIALIIFTIYQTYVSTSVSSWTPSMVLFYAFTLLGFFVLFVAIAYYCCTVLVNDHKAKEYSQLKDYTNMIENMYSDLRSFKHDYLNILSALAGYIETENIKELKDYYYKELLPESNEILNKDMSMSLLSHIKISPLKALLASKITSAHSNGIDVKIELIDDIEFINMSIIDICRIIGILMDNAIEGSILCDHKFIHFLVVNTENETIFNISNSCLSSTPPIHKLYQKNFSTKGEGRGLGLNNIKDIIDKRYNNVLFNTTIENCIFKQELVIRNK